MTAFGPGKKGSLVTKGGCEHEELDKYTWILRCRIGWSKSPEVICWMNVDDDMI